VIDEVQRVPELLNVVHDLIETEPDRQFILTGSSARKLRRGGVDLMAGRAVVRHLHPFMAAELPQFNLARSLHIGLVPLVTQALDPGDTLAAYATLYLNEEIRAEGLTRDIGRFARFLEAISFSHGSVLNISGVARDAQTNRKTVEGYVEILEDLLLAFRIPVFRRRAKRTTVTHPKFYFFDAGVYLSIRPRGPLDRPEESHGAALEGLVAQHLRAMGDYRPDSGDLHYWRTRSGLEVDFVVYGTDGIAALEVKNTERLRPEDFRGLRAFCAEYPEAISAVLYRGRDRLELDGISCLPVDQFLGRLTPDRSVGEAIRGHS
jgi:predicted AAA+ superfamily ATPase